MCTILAPLHDCLSFNTLTEEKNFSHKIAFKDQFFSNNVKG